MGEYFGYFQTDAEGGLDGHHDGDANAADPDEIVTIGGPLDADSDHIVTDDEVRADLEQKEVEQDDEFRFVVRSSSSYFFLNFFSTQ